MFFMGVDLLVESPDGFSLGLRKFFDSNLHHYVVSCVAHLDSSYSHLARTLKDRMSSQLQLSLCVQSP